MNDLKTAARMALEALDHATDAQSNPARREFPTIHDFGQMRRAADALRAALEAPQAEPVAYVFPNTAVTGRNRWMMLREDVPANDEYGGAMWVPLYAAPQPAREPAWLRVIDDALVVHHVGVANADDDYETARDKLHNLLMFAQEIGAHHAKRDAQQAREPVPDSALERNGYF